MARHRGEPGVDLPDFTCADPVDRSLHVVEDTALRHTAQYAERLGQRIEQHLVRLQRIGPDDERLAVRQLGMCGLQLNPLAGNHRQVFAPRSAERREWKESVSKSSNRLSPK